MATTRDETVGYLLGLVAVTAFAMTLPATRVAVRALGPVFVGLGRAVCAAVLGATFLFLTRQPLPSLEEAKRLVIVSAGVAVGFPLFTAWAMRFVDASHGGVVLGVLPLATATAGARFSGERPSRAFWASGEMNSHHALQGTARKRACTPTLAVSERVGGWTMIDWSRLKPWGNDTWYFRRS